MRLKGLITRRKFRVVGVMVKETCPAERFVTSGEKQYQAYRTGLQGFLRRAADEGIDPFPSSALHLVNREEGIYEFIKGPLRLLFFKGIEGEIVVCTGGYIKKSQKADHLMVAGAIRMKQNYLEAKENHTVEVIDEGVENGNAG
ncbi:MAG: hypothetical protein ACYCY2_09540 [Acidithiobacillus ferriphilus]